MKVLLGAVAIALGALPAGRARGEESFRCESGRIVSVGDRMNDVQGKCGDPDFVGQRTEKRKVKVKVRRFVGNQVEEVVEEQEVDVVIDEWTYDFGPRKLVRYVSFENERVVHVAAGKYGHKKD